jgi:hypothetical protein
VGIAHFALAFGVCYFGLSVLGHFMDHPAQFWVPVLIIALAGGLIWLVYVLPDPIPIPEWALWTFLGFLFLGGTWRLIRGTRAMLRRKR